MNAARQKFEIAKPTIGARTHDARHDLAEPVAQLAHEARALRQDVRGDAQLRAGRTR